MLTTKTLILLSIFLLLVFFLKETNLTKNYLKKIEKENPKVTIINNPSSIKILAFGDLMLGRHVETLISRGENMFENISALKSEFPSDYILVNLENPITESEISIDKAINLKMNPKNTLLLKENDINLVSLANNHIEDYFQKGINDTIKNLTEFNINYFGLDTEPLLLEKNGIKLAFFGINALWGDIEPYYKKIGETKYLVDYVLVSIHWGDEYKSFPNEKQKEVGQRLIDSGAKIILGHHPHTTQPVEKYKDGVIFYSLGNFIFDQIDPVTHKELGVGIILEEDKMNFQLFPMAVVNFKPKLLSNDKILECKNLSPDIELEADCKFSI